MLSAAHRSAKERRVQGAVSSCEGPLKYFDRDASARLKDESGSLQKSNTNRITAMSMLHRSRHDELSAGTGGSSSSLSFSSPICFEVCSNTAYAWSIDPLESAE